MTIDNGNHLLLSGNRAALDYLRSIGAEHRLTGPATRGIFLRRSRERRALDAALQRRPLAVLDLRSQPARAGNAPARLSAAGAASLGAAGQDGRRGHRLQGRALRAAGRAAASRGAQYRCAAGLGAARGRHHPRNARRRRARLPAADRARGLGRDADRAGARALCSSAAPTCAWSISCAPCVLPASGSRRWISAARPIALARRRRGHSRGAALCRRVAGARPRQCRRNSAPSSTRISASSRPPEQPPILGVLNGTVQWIFAFPGRLSVTISAGDRLIDTPREELAKTIWSEVARVTGLAACAAALADRARAARDVRGDARRRTPNGPARRRNGAISCLPAIGQIPACPLPSKARSDPAIAPPTSIAKLP